jgi:stage II sporulation protein D
MHGALSSTGLMVFVLAAACGTRPALPDAVKSDAIRVRVGNQTDGIIRTVRLEEYVAGAVLSELHPAATDSEHVRAMFDVQTIIARTYARAHRGRHAREGFDLCATSHCQLYEPARLARSRWAVVARAAAARTAGTILWHDGAPADAVYHADCGGHTSAAADVWGGAGFPYLRARRDGGSAKAAHQGWQYAVDAATLQRALDSDPRTRLGRPPTAIVVVRRDRSGRAQRVVLHGPRNVTVAGAELREVLSAAFGPRSLRSTRFEVTMADGQFRFSGSGFGHGVGLCQAGARARVAAGDSPETVLQHYYPGTVLAREGDAMRSRRRAGD